MQAAAGSKGPSREVRGHEGRVDATEGFEDQTVVLVWLTGEVVEEGHVCGGGLDPWGFGFQWRLLEVKVEFDPPVL